MLINKHISIALITGATAAYSDFRKCSSSSLKGALKHIILLLDVSHRPNHSHACQGVMGCNTTLDQDEMRAVLWPMM